MGIDIRTPGVHHIALRVADFTRARSFYLETLGFPVAMERPNFLIFLAGETAIAVRGPEGTASGRDAFDPFRVGLDHIAVGCEEEAELDRVAEALRQAGAWTTGVKLDETLGKRYVAFKDPDGIKWELYMAPQKSIDARKRSEQLHAIARGYVSEGLGKKNFDAIPYAESVTLRAPLCPGGSSVPLKGRENLRTKWWAPLPRLVKHVEVLDTFVNEDLSAVTVEFHCQIVDPPCTLRILDRFAVNADGEIVDQENFFDPRDVTNPGWQGSPS